MAKPNGYNTLDAVLTFGSDADLSAAVDLGFNCDLFGILMPDGIDGTVLQFHVSNAIDGTYVVLNDNAGSPIQITGVAADEYNATNPAVGVAAAVAPVTNVIVVTMSPACNGTGVAWQTPVAPIALSSLKRMSLFLLPSTLACGENRDASSSMPRPKNIIAAPRTHRQTIAIFKVLMVVRSTPLSISCSWNALPRGVFIAAPCFYCPSVLCPAWLSQPLRTHL